MIYMGRSPTLVTQLERMPSSHTSRTYVRLIRTYVTYVYSIPIKRTCWARLRPHNALHSPSYIISPCMIYEPAIADEVDPSNYYLAKKIY